MSIEAHLQSIAKKRDLLKLRISDEMSHPSPNFETIRELKKQNLTLKEETARYLRQMKAAATA